MSEQSFDVELIKYLDQNKKRIVMTLDGQTKMEIFVEDNKNE